jgi:hypothetical protein
VLTEDAARRLEDAEGPSSLEGLWAYAIYRDRDGTIIGGADDKLDVAVGADEPVACEVPLRDPFEVPGIDPDLTEVYVVRGPLE